MNKYKKGDKFIDTSIVEILDVEDFISGANYRTNCGVMSEENLDALQPYHEPVWRDGAVEKPMPGEDIRYMKKRYEQIGVIRGYCWEDSMRDLGFSVEEIYWLPLAEFEALMPKLPKLPESQIEPCFMPGCDGICILQQAEHPLEFWVECKKCGYASSAKDGYGEAIKAHNEIARKVRTSPKNQV